MPLVCDLLVVGGGPAGAATALTASRQGLHVILAEASPMDADATGPWTVGESLPPAARPLLEALGLMDVLENGPHLPSWGNCSAWGQDVLQTTDFIHDARAQHGWHLDRRSFDAALRRKAQDAGVRLLGGTRVQIARVPGDGDNRWAVTARAPGGQLHEVRPRYLVDATGRAAALTRRLAPQRAVQDLSSIQRQIALPLLFSTGSDHDRDTRTLVESVPDGWWYSALLPERRRMVMLFTDVDLVRPQERRVSDLEIRLARTAHLSGLIGGGGWQVEGALRPQAADAVQRRPMAGHRWLAVGDAAVAFDPLASQGLFHALYSGLKAGPAVAAALHGDLEPVAALALRFDEVFRRHLRQCEQHYLQEQRFTDQPYWQRRHRVH